MSTLGIAIGTGTAETLRHAIDEFGRRLLDLGALVGREVELVNQAREGLNGVAAHQTFEDVEKTDHKL